MKLLIVDDHAGARQMLRELLTSPQVAIRECACADEAVQTVQEFKPDWITMDVRMPGLNSLKAVAEILAASPATRIVIVTADNQPYLRRAAREAGAAHYISKDNLSELRELFAQALASEDASQV